MTSLDEQRKNLDLVTRFLGRGSPQISLWFTGLEEGGSGLLAGYAYRCRPPDRDCRQLLSKLHIDAREARSVHCFGTLRARQRLDACESHQQCPLLEAY